MRYVITGVAGFVGSSIADALLADGHEVIGVDCFIDYYPREIKERNLHHARSFEAFKFIEKNLIDLDLVALCEGATAVFHQAAQAGVRASWGKDFEIYTTNNILATQRLLEAARHHIVAPHLKQIVYASSSSVYGDAETLPTTELMRPQPISPYGVSKLAAEHLMVLYSKEFAVPTVSLRYFTVYGPRQRPDMAFHKFIRAALTKQPLDIYGTGEQTRDFTFIKDIVSANIAAANGTVESRVFNIGGGSRVSIKEVLAMLESIIGTSLNVRFHQRQSGDALHTGADTSLALKELDYRPTVALAEGLKAEVEWLDALLRES